MATKANIPLSRVLNKDGYLAPEWLQYFLSPSVITIQITGGVSPTSGGTGLTTAPTANQLLIGDGAGGYALTNVIPAVAMPAFSGDASSVAGGATLTLATVNAAPGSFGSGSAVSTMTVNAKGLVTAASSTNITGASAMTVTGVFGCNGKTGQAASTVNAAIAGTAGATYTATEQGLINSLLALVNQLRTALVNNGIAV